MTASPSDTVELESPTLAAIKAHFIGATGLTYYSDKSAELAEGLARRMRECGESDYRGYWERLTSVDSGEGELRRLIEHLTIGETSFFRHEELFDGLREVALPELIERNRSTRRLRVWSAGCSNGAELYSVAILLRRHFADQLAGWNVSLLGTDINERFLARAAAGVFREWDFRSASSADLDDCFTRRGEEWIIKPEYRVNTSFQYHNLVSDSISDCLGGFHLILCRNVIIYFADDLIKRVIVQFQNSLLEEGWLLVGHAEPEVERFRAFDTVNVPGAVMYRKRSREQISRTPEGQLALDPVWATRLDATSDRKSNTRKKLRPIRTRPKSAQSVIPDRSQVSELAQIRAKADAGELESALAACRAIVTSRRSDPELQTFYALLLEQVGERAAAEQALERVTCLFPRYAAAHYFYGLLLQKHGRRGEAAQTFTTALELLEAVPNGRRSVGPDGLTAATLVELVRKQHEVLKRP